MYIYVLFTYTFYKQERLAGPTIAKVKKYLAFQAHLIFQNYLKNARCSHRELRVDNSYLIALSLRTYIYISYRGMSVN